MRVDDQPRIRDDDDEEEMSEEQTVSQVTDFPADIHDMGSPSQKKKVRLNARKYIYSVYD